MKDIHEQTYYELLEVPHNASQEDILKAYNRARATYGSNSPALYSLMNKQEAQELLQLIDEAYAVLSNQFKRRQYDRTKMGQAADPIPPPKPAPKLPPPSQPATIPPVHHRPTQPKPQQIPGVTRFGKYQVEEAFEEELKIMEEFPGATLQKIRNYKNITLDQMSDFTKVSRPYLTAVESENFSSLPAPVFVRGFLVQIAAALQLDATKVVASYMRRMKDPQKK